MCKRLIYVLLYKNGKFCLSRNFGLQTIGDKYWLFNNYNFGYVSKYIDELVILNVEEKREDFALFFENVQFVLDNVFVPVALGGGIRNIETARRFFDIGADKVVLNTSLHLSPSLVEEISAIYGTQSIVASVDYKKSTNSPYVNNGKKKLELSLDKFLIDIQKLPIGEILLSSIERDGTGFGFDLETIQKMKNFIKVPLIVAGGAGKKEHFLEVARINEVDAFSTANLLNFIGESLPKTREFLIKEEVNLAVFDF